MKTRMPVRSGVAGLALALSQALAQPTLTKQPTDLSISLHAVVQFTVSARTSGGPLSFRWWFNDAPLDLATHPSAGRATLTLSDATQPMAGSYWVVVSDDNGAVTSRVSTLTVDPTFSKVRNGPPVDDPAGGYLCATWGDYDADGDLDLAVVGGYYDDGGLSLLIYTNRGSATLALTSLAPFTTPRRINTANWADYDNDGDLDLWAGTLENTDPVLFANQGAGRFTALAVSTSWIENRVGVRGSLQAWADYDGDGYLDLAVTRGLSELGNRPPMALLRNSANGGFTVLTNNVVGTIRKNSECLGWIDYDGDRDLDLLSTVDGPFLIRHDRDWLNVEPSEAFQKMTEWALHFTWGDYDNDGDADVYCSRFSLPAQLCRNEGLGHFIALEDVAVQPLGVRSARAAAWGDYDNDGYLDLFVSRGHYTRANRNALFHNDRKGGFEEVLTGSVVNEPADSFQGTWVDYDNDGDLDLFVVNAANTVTTERDFFYVNNGNTNGWLEVKPVGAAPQQGGSNRDAIGAHVRVKATIGGKTFWQLRTITSSSWHTELVAHFGLGDAEIVEALRIEWPSGMVQEFVNVPARQILRLEESLLLVNVSADQVEPARYEVMSGALVTIEAPEHAAADTYQWLFNGQEIGGATGRTLRIGAFETPQVGDYSVRMTGLADPSLGRFTAEARPVRLEVKHRPVLGTPLLSTQKVSAGARVELTAQVRGSDAFVCQWQKNGTDIAASDNVSATNLTLVLHPVQITDAGDYRVTVQSGTNSVVSEAAHLDVDPTFTKLTAGPIVTEERLWEFPSWWDLDEDGFLDLFIAQNAAGVRMTDTCFRNARDGTFTALPPAALVAGQALAGAIGDYDNDGYDDLFLIQYTGADDLFRNERGERLIRLPKSLVGPPAVSIDSSMDVGWADYDRDGLLDLFAANSVDAAARDCLYRNTGDGPFLRMTTDEVGMLVADQDPAGSVAWADYDNDGWPDLWRGAGMWNTDPEAAEQLWHSNGDGSFSPALTAGSVAANSCAGVGYWADSDNNGFLDLFIASLTNSLHRTSDGRTFLRVPATPDTTHSPYAAGADWGDYDNDGWLDLFIVQYWTGSPSALYHNRGDGTFERLDVGSPIRDGFRRVMPAWADYDNDGFLDLLITCGDVERMPNVLYRNNGNGNAWLKIKLVGTTSNRSAIGAKVRVKATIKGQMVAQMREISGNSGISGGAGGLPAHFGLGDASAIELIRIEWPSGMVQELTDVRVKQVLTVTEPPALEALGQGLIRILCWARQNYEIQVSDDLETWTSLGVVATDQHRPVVLDPGAAARSHRFYRAKGL